MNCESSKPSPAQQRPAFSLVELVVVVMIVGIVSAIATPRVSKAGRKAQANALRATLTNVRRSMDHYYAEHGQYPGIDPASGEADGEVFVDQLTLYSDKLGNTKDAYGDPFVYGPYLRKPFPKNPLNDLDTVKVKKNGGDADPADGSVGWVAVVSSRRFGISASDSDLNGIGVGNDKERSKVRGK